MTRDPYQVLGLPGGASAAEVKRAYRRLAKALHPDSAGEGALPRFLEIQRAYEQLTTPAWRPGRRRPGGGEPSRGEARPGGSSRARPAAGEGARPGATAGAGPRPKRDGDAPPQGPGHRRRSARKATFGSTTYDEAHDPSDPAWSGAAWYGPTSGEYWRVNPREYADPRKHGPEYQARAAERAARAERAAAAAQPVAPDPRPQTVETAVPTREPAVPTREPAVRPSRLRRLLRALLRRGGGPAIP